MNNENKKLKDLINMSLDENPIPYEDKYWKAAEKLLDKEKRKSGWMFFMVPATIIVALSGAYLFWNNNTAQKLTNNSVITEQQSQTTLPNTDEASITTAEAEKNVKVENNSINVNNDNTSLVEASRKTNYQGKKKPVYSIKDKPLKEQAASNLAENIGQDKESKPEDEKAITPTENNKVREPEAVLISTPENTPENIASIEKDNNTDNVNLTGGETNPPSEVKITPDNNSNDTDLSTNQPLSESKINANAEESGIITTSETKAVEETENISNDISKIETEVVNDKQSDSALADDLNKNEIVEPQPLTQIEEQIAISDSAEKIADQAKETEPKDIEPAPPIEVKIEKQKRPKQFSFGFLAGAGLTPAITSQIGNKYNYLSYKAGLNVDYTIGKIGISTGANYHIRNGYNYSLVTIKKGYSFGTSNIRTEYLPMQSRYLEIPLMLHFKTGRHLVGVGGAFEYMLQTKLKVENHGNQTTTTEVGNYDFMHQYDIGIMVQYQYTINSNFSIGLNLFQGSVDAVNNEKSTVTKKDINRFIEPILIYKLIKR